MEIRPPQTVEEYEAYYHLRWLVLRAPWDQPEGSEKDALEGTAYHLAAFTDHQLIGVGRLHAASETTAQIRYMAVSPDHQGEGAGAAILEKLEQYAVENQIQQIELNARDAALSFYQKHGYTVIKTGHLLYGEIPHTVMSKALK